MLAAATLPLFLVTPAPAQSLADLGFLAGCWEGETRSARGAGTIEEHYTRPSENLILGTTRYLTGGAATFFEFSRIERTQAGIVLTPYPGGRASDHGFRLTRAAGGEAVFEAPEHDFPRRIAYRRLEDGSLLARIDGGEGSGEAREWRLLRVACP